MQPDPRHYLSQGWIYGFANGETGYPLHWTKLKAWGVDKPEPQRGIGTGGLPVEDWPAHGWHEFRDPNEEWELTHLPVQRQRRPAAEPEHRERAQRQGVRAVDPELGARSSSGNIGAWMHVEHILGLYVFAQCNRSGPTNMHNTAMAVNSAHKIRFAQDLALYNLTLSEEIDGLRRRRAPRRVEQRPGMAGRPQGHRGAHGRPGRLGRVDLRRRTSCSSRWSVSCSAATWSCRSRRRNGDFVTPTVVGAGEYDYSQRDLRWTMACFGPLTQDREFADHNKQLMQGWLTHWVPQCLEAARTLQPIWSQVDAKPPRFEDSSTRPRTGSPGIVSDLGLDTPEELKQ